MILVTDTIVVAVVVVVVVAEDVVVVASFETYSSFVASVAFVA